MEAVCRIRKLQDLLFSRVTFRRLVQNLTLEAQTRGNSFILLINAVTKPSTFVSVVKRSNFGRHPRDELEPVINRSMYSFHFRPISLINDYFNYFRFAEGGDNDLDNAYSKYQDLKRAGQVGPADCDKVALSSSKCYYIWLSTYKLPRLSQLLKLCARYGDGERALAVYDDFSFLGTVEQPELLGSLCISLSRSVHIADSRIKRSHYHRVQEMDRYYQMYISLAKEQKWFTNAQVYVEMAKAYRYIFKRVLQQ
jgi:hypothetical protein